MKQFSGWGHIWRMAGVVLFSTLVPLGLGIWLDRRFNMAPVFVLIGALIGILGGTVGVVRIASRMLDALGRMSQSKTRAEEEVVGKEDRA